MKRKLLPVILMITLLCGCSQVVSEPREFSEVDTGSAEETIPPSFEEATRDDSNDTSYTVNFSDFTMTFTHPASDLEIYPEVMEDYVLELVNKEQCVSIVRSTYETQPRTFEEYYAQEMAKEDGFPKEITGNSVMFGDFEGYYYDYFLDMGDVIGVQESVGYILFGHDREFIIYTNSYRKDFRPQPIGNIVITINE